jgi:ElaB/YqjD/DUF883 family membrane-anchored ribosome-binding protein
MKKLVKVALVAGAAGATAGAVQAFRKDESTEVIARKAMTGAGEAAAVGALVGYVLDRRDKKRRAKAKARFGASIGTAGLVEVARAARPALEHAVEALSSAAESARPKVEHAYESARPRVEQAYESARPHVEHAAKAARERAIEAAEAARPRVEHAVEVARPKVEQAAKAARERATEVAEQARRAA